MVMHINRLGTILDKVLKDLRRNRLPVYIRTVHRASIKLFELGIRTPGGLFLGVRYAAGVDFQRFRTPSLPIFGESLGLLETKKM